MRNAEIGLFAEISLYLISDILGSVFLQPEAQVPPANGVDIHTSIGHPHPKPGRPVRI
jgi:hypothetical protein